jgi:hypothetical protein
LPQVQETSFTLSRTPREPRQRLEMEMNSLVARTAERDEIFFHIPSQLAARLHMMNLQILGTSASLALPAIAVNNPLTKSPTGTRIQAKPGLSWDWWIHEAFGIRNRNSCRWEFGSSR